MTRVLLRDMIERQAGAVAAIADTDLWAQVAVLKAADRILITGTGSSRYAAELGAMAFESAQRDAMGAGGHVGPVERRTR